VSAVTTKTRQVDTILLVNDVSKSKKFYSELIGLDILHDWESMVIFKNRLALHQFDLLQPRELLGSLKGAHSIGSDNVIIYLGTDDIVSEFTRLSGFGVKFIHGIVELPWQKIFRFRDIDGYIIEIGEEKEI